MGVFDWFGKRTKSDDAAIALYRQVVRSHPENPDAWCLLGVAYSKLDRHDDAIEAYRQATRIKSEDATAWLGLGVAYVLSGNRTAALDAVQELRRLDPRKADSLFNLMVPRRRN